MYCRRAISLLILVAFSSSGRADDARFESKVRPILAKACFSCHGKAKQESGLRLDNRGRLLKGGTLGPAVVPGDPAKSLLIKAIGRHGDLKMPPKKPLAPHEVAELIRWVKQGAKWPNTPQQHFRDRIRPVLEKRCFDCHGGTAKGGLRLNSRQAALKGGKSGPAVVLGSPEKSLLIKALDHQAKLKMPPKSKLPDKVIADFRRWIQDGAVWSDEAQVGTVGPSQVTPAQRAFWSFQPVKAPAPPQVSDPKWDEHAIDRFIYDRLHSQGLRPADLADRRTLIRRATFDLIGLPPSPEEVEAFLSDKESGAFERVIDRLLASRHYGERWGRHWLDVVRYADTAGDAGDFPVPEAYMYRNYVIRSFNNDKPYDQFLREQIAGDLLPFESDEQRWEQVIATGYIAISRRIGVSPQNLKHITIEDTIDNLGKTMLGLSLGCARCHDHKFDPIPTSDYYSLYGIFASSVYPHAGAEHSPYRYDFVYRIGKTQADKQLAPHRAKLAAWDKKERAKFQEYRALQSMKIVDPTRTREVLWREVMEIRERRRPVAESFPPLDIAYAISDGEARDARIQKAGNPRAPGPFVRRGFLQVLGGDRLSENVKGSGRLELAGWVTRQDNPLTARVMVNRLWHYHFGRGLVASTSDFGIRGSRPTHPKLLDYLADRFVKSGWSLKKMHRMMMLSRVYRLSSRGSTANSKVDPNNELYWRYNRRRLDADEIRDSMLLLAGKLDRTPGGRHPFPHHLTYFYRQHEPFSERYETNQRSVYMMQQRIQKNDYLDLFDGPDGNVSLSERKATTTTLQALFLMNSKMIQEIARDTAKRLIKGGRTDDARVAEAYLMIFGRKPTSGERKRSVDFLQRTRQQAQSLSPDKVDFHQLAWTNYIQAMLSSNEFLFVD